MSSFREKRTLTSLINIDRHAAVLPLVVTTRRKLITKRAPGPDLANWLHSRTRFGVRFSLFIELLKEPDPIMLRS